MRWRARGTAHHDRAILLRWRCNEVAHAPLHELAHTCHCMSWRKRAIARRRSGAVKGWAHTCHHDGTVLVGDVPATGAAVSFSIVFAAASGGGTVTRSSLEIEA